jgi:DNA-binding FadR family transcriptional regulator
MAEQVADVLRERILTGLAEGAPLPKQDEIVAEFGVSYPSVRESLRILETEGLISIRRGNVGGAVVHPPGAATAGYSLGIALQANAVDVADLARALAVLEPMSAARCAAREDRGDTVVPVLDALLEASEQALDDPVEFTRLSREFHEAITRYDDNATLRLVVRGLSSLWSAQEETWAEASSARGAYPEMEKRQDVLRAHRRITEEITRGHAQAAERVARTHIEATQAVVLPAVGDAIVDAASRRARQHFRSLG